jgi:hypothetical protein
LNYESTESVVGKNLRVAAVLEDEMEWLAQLLSGGAGQLMTGIGAMAKDIRTAITGEAPLDPNQRAEVQLKLAAMEQALLVAAQQYDISQMQGQIEINKIEAASASGFSKNWRPAVGWICCAGLCYVFLVRPLLPWIIQVGGIIVGERPVIPELPDIPMTDMMMLLGGLLGLGGMRTFEKVKGVTK